MANWEKLIEEHYNKKKEVDASLIMEMIDLELENTFQSGAIDGHAGKRLSTKGIKKTGGEPFDEDPPKARSKSAPAGFGVLEEEDIDEAALQRKDLHKDPARLQAFLQKIKNGEEFELVDGGTIKVDGEKSKEYIDYVVQDEKVPSKVKLISPDGKQFSLSALQKTKDFGSNSSDTPNAKPCEKMDPTRFEGNLQYGLLIALGAKQKAKVFRAKAEENNKIVCSPEALKAGISIGKVIAGKVKGLSADGIGKASAGSEDKASLTDTYIRHGVTSNEPKADIRFGNLGVSIKKKEDSQFMAAQGPELSAILDVAIKDQEGEGIDAELDNNIQEFLGTLSSSLNKDKFYTNREKLQKVTGKIKSGPNVGKDKVDKTPLDKILTRFLNVGVDDYSEEDKAELQKVYSGTAQSALSSLRENIKKVLENSKFKEGIVKEGLTGNGKFNEEWAKASAMLTWSVSNPGNSDYEVFNDTWFTEKAAKAKLGIRDRGSSRGGGLRGELDKLEEHSQVLVLEEFSEQDYAAITESARDIENGFLSDELVMEGFKDIAKSFSSAVGKGKDWVVKTAKNLASMASKVVSAIGTYLRKLLDKGFSYFLKFLGLDVYSLQIPIS